MNSLSVPLFLTATIILSVISAEPPRRFFPRQQFGRLESAPAPQPPSTSYGAPQQGYGPPQEPAPSYGPPPTPAPSYGPPPAPAASYGPPPIPADSYGPPPSGQITTEISITTDANSESITESPQEETNAKLRESGNFYYIYHPNGALEKLTFKPSQRFNSRLVQRPEEPVSGAVYTYDSNNFVLRRI